MVVTQLIMADLVVNRCVSIVIEGTNIMETCDVDHRGRLTYLVDTLVTKADYYKAVSYAITVNVDYYDYGYDFICHVEINLILVSKIVLNFFTVSNSLCLIISNFIVDRYVKISNET